MADKKFRSFAGTLYPDSESYDCEHLLSVIRSKFIDWAYILHDKDVNENGELKKPHIHWVGRATPRCLSVVSNFLGLPENDIEVVKNFDNMVMYLIHLNDIDKFQYSPDDVETNLPNIGQLLRRQSEGQIVKELASAKMQKSWYDLVQYAVDIDSYDILRRNLGVIRLIWEEVQIADAKRLEDGRDVFPHSVRNDV
jgi:hypothetical protein